MFRKMSLLIAFHLKELFFENLAPLVSFYTSSTLFPVFPIPPTRVSSVSILMAFLEFRPTALQSQPSLVTPPRICLVTIRMIRWPRSIRSLSRRGQSFPTQSISHTRLFFLFPFDHSLQLCSPLLANCFFIRSHSPSVVWEAI